MAAREETGPGLAVRVVTAWADMRGSMRWLLARAPGETTILVFFVVSGILGWAGSLARLWIGPDRAGLSEAEVTGTILGGIAFFGFLWPLFLYLVALAAHGLARLFRGAGSGRDSRAAMAWAVLVASPVGLVASTAAFALQQGGPSVAASILGLVAPVAFLYAAAECFAEAHGFRRAWTLLAALALAAALVWSVVASVSWW
jgi:hypothetical protein